MNNSKMNYLKKFFNILYVIVLSIPLILLLVACIFPTKQINNTYAIEETTTTETETTINFNQLIKGSDFLNNDSSLYRIYSNLQTATLDINNGVATITSIVDNELNYRYGLQTNFDINLSVGDSYYFTFEVFSESINSFNVEYGGNNAKRFNIELNEWNKIMSDNIVNTKYNSMLLIFPQTYNIPLNNGYKIRNLNLTRVNNTLSNIDVNTYYDLFPLNYSYNEGENITISSLTITNNIGNQAEQPLQSNEKKQPNYSIMYSLYDFYTLPLNNFYSSSMLEFLGIIVDRDTTFSYLVLYPLWLIWASMIKILVDMFTMIPKLLRKLFKTEV